LREEGIQSDTGGGNAYLNEELVLQTDEGKSEDQGGSPDQEDKLGPVFTQEITP